MSVEQLSPEEGAEPGRVHVLASAVADFQERELRYRELLDALPTAIYATDAQGRIIFYNEACVTFSGRRPEIGSDRWCVPGGCSIRMGRP